MATTELVMGGGRGAEGATQAVVDVVTTVTVIESAREGVEDERAREVAGMVRVCWGVKGEVWNEGKAWFQAEEGIYRPLV